LIYYPPLSKLQSVLPTVGVPFVQFFIQYGQEFSFPAELIAGICWQESHFGEALSPKGAGGTGDWSPGATIGHGRGLMQIDDRWHADWIDQLGSAGSPLWTDPASNIRYGTNLLSTYRLELQNDGVLDIRAQVAAYNSGVGGVLKALKAGENADYSTTGRNYAQSVLEYGSTWHLLAKNGQNIVDCDCVLCEYAAAAEVA
jgi:membrane-bound lytic murein transglycosylase MltF